VQVVGPPIVLTVLFRLPKDAEIGFRRLPMALESLKAFANPIAFATSIKRIVP
jgi:hypothetical protein